MRGVAALCVAALAMACEPEKPASPIVPTTPLPPVPQAYTRIFLCCGANGMTIPATRQLQVRAVYPSGTIVDITPEVRSWSSSNPAVATISNTGMVQALTEGTTELRAEFQGLISDPWAWTMRLPSRLGPPTPDEIIGRVQEITPVNVVDLSRATVTVAGGARDGFVTTADSSGEFRIWGLDAPGFDLLISKPGYETLRFNVNALGTDFGRIPMRPDASTISDVLSGDICQPRRSVNITFTPARDGLFRLTSINNAVPELFVGSHRLARLFVNTELELEDGVEHELRLTGDCGGNLTSVSGRVTYLRPR